ncbi:MAG: ATP-binding protein [Deltaproteobacteria bacterium]|nr:ATP-binding protein [Deltaproteobacteria bacterium]
MKVHLDPLIFAKFSAQAAELQPILDAMPAYIFLAHDPGCLQITGNSMTYDLLGVPSGSNLSGVGSAGEPGKFRIMRDDRELPFQEFPLHRAAKGQIVREAEVDLVLDDGSVRSLLGNAQPLLGEDGLPRGAMAVFVDISAPRRLEETLRRAQEENEQRLVQSTTELNRAVDLLEEEIKLRRQVEEKVRGLNEELEARVQERTSQLQAANRELEAFSYSVSHDLKAPIRAIDGFSRILLSEHAAQLDAEGRRLLKVICTNTRIMGQLIDDLLGLSHLGRKPMRKTLFNLAALSRQVFKSLKVMARKRRIQLIIKDLPPAYGDLSLITQVLVNLLTNAIKFTRPKKNAIIEVGGWIKGMEKVYYVKDNGIGFDERYAHQLFGAFQRLHGSEEYEGTGIGLAIVHRIIQRHGGRVWAEGKVNQGAGFYFTLPKHTEESSSERGEPAKEPPPE